MRERCVLSGEDRPPQHPSIHPAPRHQPVRSGKRGAQARDHTRARVICRAPQLRQDFSSWNLWHILTWCVVGDLLSGERRSDFLSPSPRPTTFSSPSFPFLFPLHLSSTASSLHPPFWKRNHFCEMRNLFRETVRHHLIVGARHQKLGRN